LGRKGQNLELADRQAVAGFASKHR
jgi:hypothetical protein